ncbi:MAG TPA: 23S rRNA (guanosine(2251)-2'-O)-methyltransferase RlmB [Anaerovoracaceae bacterium]|nr:23S rRNA (guanosine(2251)-2'-O)-methyltransferase RlmB [Anaerovoracaceae bacterium]
MSKRDNPNFNKNKKNEKNEKPKVTKKSFHEEIKENDNLIIGRNPVIEALKGHTEFEKILIAKGAEGSISKIVGIAKDKQVICHYVDRIVLDKMAPRQNHQGVIAEITEYKYAEIEDILKIAIKKEEEPFIIVLDDLQDPHNLGAIMRTAECAGAHGIIVPKRNSCGLTATVAKASAGAIEHMPCVRVTNIAQTLTKLKDEGFWIAACDMGGSRYYNQDLTGKLCLVIGNEGKGISQLVKKKCDFVVSIPMKGKISSLNASNAAAVIIYEVRKQRDMVK